MWWTKEDKQINAFPTFFQTDFPGGHLIPQSYRKAESVWLEHTESFLPDPFHVQIAAEWFAARLLPNDAAVNLFFKATSSEFQVLIQDHFNERGKKKKVWPKSKKLDWKKT